MEEEQKIALGQLKSIEHLGNGVSDSGRKWDNYAYWITTPNNRKMKITAFKLYDFVKPGDIVRAAYIEKPNTNPKYAQYPFLNLKSLELAEAPVVTPQQPAAPVAPVQAPELSQVNQYGDQYVQDNGSGVDLFKSPPLKPVGPITLTAEEQALMDRIVALGTPVAKEHFMATLTTYITLGFDLGRAEQMWQMYSVPK